MRKMEYLDALKRAMLGLPPEIQAKTLAFYEQRFVDGIAAGSSEEEIGAGLEDPARIAMTLRESAHMRTFTEQKGAGDTGRARTFAERNSASETANTRSFSERKSAGSVLRMLFTAAGLAIFNLFMLVPAAVAGALLISVYAAGGACYSSGIVVTASALAGANEFVFDEPLRFMAFDGKKNITVYDRKHPNGASATIRFSPRGIEVTDNAAAGKPADNADDSTSVIEEDARNGSIHIITDMDASSRNKQVAAGIGLVLGGIALILIAIVITRYCLLGVKRYLQMNLSLIKGS